MKYENRWFPTNFWGFNKKMWNVILDPTREPYLFLFFIYCWFVYSSVIKMIRTTWKKCPIRKNFRDSHFRVFAILSFAVLLLKEMRSTRNRLRSGRKKGHRQPRNRAEILSEQPVPCNSCPLSQSFHPISCSAYHKIEAEIIVQPLMWLLVALWEGRHRSKHVSIRLCGTITKSDTINPSKRSSVTNLWIKFTVHNFFQYYLILRKIVLPENVPSRLGKCRCPRKMPPSDIFLDP